MKIGITVLFAIDFGPSDYVGNINNENLSNYAKACPEGSALRRKEVGEDVTDATSDRKTFIHDPIKANDLCEHPDFKNMHGHTVVNGTNLTPLLPLFSWAKMPTHSDILVTPLEQYWDQYDVGHRSIYTHVLKNVLKILGLGL